MEGGGFHSGKVAIGFLAPEVKSRFLNSKCKDDSESQFCFPRLRYIKVNLCFFALMCIICY